jgi:hypothetical protein
MLHQAPQKWTHRVVVTPGKHSSKDCATKQKLHHSLVSPFTARANKNHRPLYVSWRTCMKVCQGTTANCTFVLEPESLKFLFINKLSFLHPQNNKKGNKKRFFRMPFNSNLEHIKHSSLDKFPNFYSCDSIPQWSGGLFEMWQIQSKFPI